MATFVHIFPAEKEKSIVTVGIKADKIHFDDISKGVFCMPVISDFYASHQWVREIMRRHKNVLAAYFRIPDNLEVYMGKYNELHKKANAVSSIEIFQKLDDKMGFQVIVPRSIETSEVFRIKKIPPLGWRYYPSAKGKNLCLCPACICKGEFGNKKLLNSKLSQLEKKLSVDLPTSEQAKILSEISELMGDHKLKLNSWESILEKVDLTDCNILNEIGYILLQTDTENALYKFIEILKTAPTKIQVDFVCPILLTKKEAGIDLFGDIAKIPEVKTQIDAFFAGYNTDN